MESDGHEIGRRNCLNKTAYGSRAQARRMRRRLKGEGVTELRVYSCPHCGAWHLTKQEEKYDRRGHLPDLNRVILGDAK
jgi:hypothetical protein